MGETIKAEAAFYSASGKAKISHVDVRDIAAALAAAASLIIALVYRAGQW